MCGTEHKARGFAVWLLLVAAAPAVVYFVALQVGHGRTIADEKHHLRVIAPLAEGVAPDTSALPMLPTYHGLVAAIASLTEAPRATGRVISLAAYVIGMLLVYDVARRVASDAPGSAGLARGDLECGSIAGREVEFAALGRLGGAVFARTLHYAWLPALFPYVALVYTDALAVMLLLAGWSAQLRGWHWAVLVALLGACAVRQSNLIWVVFLAGMASVARPSFGGAGVRVWVGAIPWGRIWPHLVVLVAGAVFVSWCGATFGDSHRNGPAFNPAQLYLFGLLVVWLSLPIWLGAIAREWVTIGRALGRITACLVALGAGVALFKLYQNPNPWNQDWWYMSNMPLMVIERYPLARAAAAALLLVGGIGLLLWGRARRAAGPMMFWLVAMIAVSLAPQYYAAARNAVVPLLLLALLAPLTVVERRRLNAWWLGHCVVLGVIAVMRGGADGGIP